MICQNTFDNKRPRGHIAHLSNTSHIFDQIIVVLSIKKESLEIYHACEQMYNYNTYGLMGMPVTLHPEQRMESGHKVIESDCFEGGLVHLY